MIEQVSISSPGPLVLRVFSFAMGRTFSVRFPPFVDDLCPGCDDAHVLCARRRLEGDRCHFRHSTCPNVVLTFMILTARHDR